VSVEAYCHCGRAVYERAIFETGKGWRGIGLCDHCTSVRCDADPGACRPGFLRDERRNAIWDALRDLAYANRDFHAAVNSLGLFTFMNLVDAIVDAVFPSAVSALGLPEGPPMSAPGYQRQR